MATKRTAPSPKDGTVSNSLSYSPGSKQNDNFAMHTGPTSLPGGGLNFATESGENPEKGTAPSQTTGGLPSS